MPSACGADTTTTSSTDRLREAALRLAPRGRPPKDRAGATAWRAVIASAARLNDSRVRRLPTTSFLDNERLDALTREARRRQPRARSRRQQHAGPGIVLRYLAVDRMLQRAVGRALGFRVVPSYLALYMYEPPRSHVPPHLDRAPYDIIVHIVLEHHGAARDGGSALVVHRRRRDVRLTVAPGEGIVLCGRGAVHQWEPLGPRERRTMVGIGFRRADGR